MNKKIKLLLTTVIAFLAFNLIAQKAIVTDFAYVVAKKGRVNISSFPFFLTDAQREILRNIVAEQVKKVTKAKEVSFTQGTSAPIDFYDREGGNVTNVKMFGKKSKKTNVTFYSSETYKEVDPSTADYFVKVEMWMGGGSMTMPKEDEIQLKIDVAIKNNKPKKNKVFKNTTKSRFFVRPTADYIMAPHYISKENNFALVKDALQVAFTRKAKIEKKEFTRERDTKYDAFLNASTKRKIVFYQDKYTVNQSGKKGKVLKTYKFKVPNKVLRRANYIGTDTRVSLVTVDHKNTKEKYQVFTIDYPNKDPNVKNIIKQKDVDRPTDVEVISKKDKNKKYVFVQTNKEGIGVDAKMVLEGTVDNKKVRAELTGTSMYLYVDDKIMGIALFFKAKQAMGGKQSKEFAYFLQKDTDPNIQKVFMNLLGTKASYICPPSSNGKPKFSVGG